MKLTLAPMFLVSALAAALSLALTAPAQAATPKPPAPALASPLYVDSWIAAETELAVTPGQITAAERRAQTRMTSCLTGDLAQIIEANAAQPRPNVTRAMGRIAAEAQAEYEMTALAPLLAPNLTEARRVLALPVSARLRSQMRSELATFRAGRSLNVCADAQAWAAAGLDPAHEPVGIRRAHRALMVALVFPNAETHIDVATARFPSARQRNWLRYRALKAMLHEDVLAGTVLKPSFAWLAGVRAHAQSIAASAAQGQTTPTSAATTAGA